MSSLLTKSLVQHHLSRVSPIQSETFHYTGRGVSSQMQKRDMSESVYRKKKKRTQRPGSPARHFDLLVLNTLGYSHVDADPRRVIDRLRVSFPRIQNTA